MRHIAAICALTLLAACTSEHGDAASNDPASGEFVGVAYYDRNNDGVADLELHRPGCDDCDWALLDDDFNGRYEMHVLNGYSLVKTAVDAPVPKAVALRVDQSPPIRLVD
jgi:hypothetical protein